MKKSLEGVTSKRLGLVVKLLTLTVNKKVKITKT